MQSKKLSIGWNTLYLVVGGASILYILSRGWAKKRKITNEKTGAMRPNEEQSQPVKTDTGSVFQQSKPLPAITFSASPIRNKVTYQEYFDWLRPLENVRYQAYRDGKDAEGNALFAIGMGHQIKPNENYLFNTTITEQKVRELFKADIEEIAAEVDRLVKIPINRNQKLALVSIRYNVGSGGFQSRNLLKTLNSGDIAGTAKMIPTFITTSDGGVFNQGLVNRRRKEQALFLKPV